MDRDKLIQRLRATFLLELREHVEAFNRELLTLEREPTEATRIESIKTLFRTAHSLKGASRAVNATKLETVCHKLEELLSALRDGSRALSPEVFEQLFAAVDTFESAGREFANERAADPAAKTASKPAFAAPPTPRPQAQTEPQPRGPAAPEPEPMELLKSQPARIASPAVAAPPSVAVWTQTPQPAAGAPSPSPDMPDRPSEISASRPSLVPVPQLASLSPLLSGGPVSEPPAPSDAPEMLVRVPERKLDLLLAGSGELLLARRRLDARSADLSQLHERCSELRTSLERRERGAVVATSGPRTHGNAARANTGSAQRGAVDPCRHALHRLEAAVDAFTVTWHEDLRALERAAQTLEERISQARMVPFTEACDALYRTVRDLAARERKPTELVVEGGDIELDRSIVDGLRAPLLHLVRNAIDHGIERAEERALLGKSARSRLVVSAALRGDQVEITVRDDGRGIDLQAVRDRLRAQGADVPAEDGAVLSSIFEAGFSTAPTVTELSGRGVGLDVVRTQIESMRGNVAVAFQPGAGTSFALTMPLTVTTLRALLVRAGNDVLALPSASVSKLVRASADQLGLVQGRETLLSEAAPMPLVSLAELLGSQEPTARGLRERLPVVILSQLGTRVALAVDELIAEQDVVIKSLGRRIQRLPHVSGATILPDGRVALLLHPGDLVRSAQGRMPARRAFESLQPTAAPARKRILLVDDSVTTRTLEKSILEGAGYHVITAADGAAAWQILQEMGADLLVSDVEMPNMNGFTLTQSVRSSKRFRDLPVILLTSLDSDQDRARGLDAGANAYLVKSAFDQSDLFDTIRQLL